MDEALKLWQPLAKLAAERIEVQTLGYEIYVRKGELSAAPCIAKLTLQGLWLAALKCLLAAKDIDAEDSRLHAQILNFRRRGQSFLCPGAQLISQSLPRGRSQNVLNQSSTPSSQHSFPPPPRRKNSTLLSFRVIPLRLPTFSARPGVSWKSSVNHLLCRPIPSRPSRPSSTSSWLTMFRHASILSSTPLHSSRRPERAPKRSVHLRRR